MGRIQAARHADPDLLGAGRLQAFDQTLGLNVEGLVAVLHALGGIGSGRKEIGRSVGARPAFAGAWMVKAMPGTAFRMAAARPHH